MAEPELVSQEWRHSQPRARVRRAVSRGRPDRVPVDFGSTALTGIHASVVAGLRDHYELDRRAPVITEPFTMNGAINDDLAEAMGVDTVGLFPLWNLFGFPNKDFKSFELNGLEVLVPGEFRTELDSNGDTLLYPAGDTNASPSGRLHRGGFFFDQIIRQPDLDEENLDPKDNLEEFQPITSIELEYFRTEAEKLRKTGRSVVLSLPWTSFGCTSQIAGAGLTRPRGIRDIVEWMISTKLRKDYVHAVFSAQAEIALENLPRIAEAVRDCVDVALVDTNDFGAQLRPLFSVATYQELFAPYHARVNSWIHEHTNWKTMKHSCGYSEPFLEHFIQAGFDIYTPVQCGAGMDPSRVKSLYGDRIVLWGGGIETQTLLTGTPATVREEVLRRCEILSAGGAFVFSCTHNIQPLTPIGNVIALVEAVREFGRA